MFAKLKKKIENEGGTISESIGKGPGLASPLSRRDSMSSLPGGGSVRMGPSPPCSVTSEDPSLRDVSSRDDLPILLQKKTEQCRKMEGNISDLAALIKDKNKTIEKLETQLRQQEEVLAKKLEEQKSEFEAYRDKLIAGYQEDKLQLDKEKTELAGKLKSAEEYRAKFFQKEEESEEMQGLSIQELAKVKHLLLNAEQELTTCRTQLETTKRQLQAAEVQVEKLTDELGPIRQELTVALSGSERLKEESRERAELITSLTKEKAAFDRRLDETNTELTEKQNQLSHLQARLSDLDGEHKTLIRSSDIQRNKTSKLLQEKDEHIDSLNERIQTLEQRLSDSALSGDERTSALQGERDGLEMRLEEARHQLTEVKSTWSDKITHLEEQISHLNAKIVEDSEEMLSNQKHAEQMRESFHKQMEDMRVRLEDAEKIAMENLELASSKETHYEKQIQEMESELSKQMLTQVDAETQLRAKIESLESQISELNNARNAERSETASRITHLEQKETQFVDREIKLEAEARQLEERHNALQGQIHAKEEEVNRLFQQLQERESAQQGQGSIISSLQERIITLESDLKKAEKGKDEYEKHLRTSEEEKGGLLERNADLYRQMEELKSSQTETRQELQRTLELQAHSIVTMEKTEHQLRQKIEALEKQIEQTEVAKAESGLYSDRMEEMTQVIASLQNQLAEKTRVVKKQEQTLKDLRVTLQRELKVQALPNDDPLDSPSLTSSPPVSRRQDNAVSKHDEATRSGARSHSQLSHFQQTNIQQQMQNSQRGSAAVLPLQANNSALMTSTVSPALPGGSVDALTVHTNSVKTELDKDVNLQYLKHVVLKFMLSRESEAIQLIKAVSMLLNFTHQEQQLIKDTLEWKMSWFGARPPPGKGQTAKVIPPTF